jgi:hypothetical protein
MGLISSLMLRHRSGSPGNSHTLNKPPHGIQSFLLDFCDGLGPPLFENIRVTLLPILWCCIASPSCVFDLPLPRHYVELFLFSLRLGPWSLAIWKYPHSFFTLALCFFFHTICLICLSLVDISSRAPLDFICLNLLH